MSKKTMLWVGTATVAALLMWFADHAVHACQVDEFYLTKESTLAATTPEALSSAVTLVQADRAKLDDLVKAGTVMQVKEGTKVQVKERSFEWKMLKIELPAGKASYWIKDGVLKALECQ